MKDSQKFSTLRAKACIVDSGEGLYQRVRLPCFVLRNFAGLFWGDRFVRPCFLKLFLSFFFDSLFERLCFERDLVGYLLVSEPENKRGCPRDLLGGRGGGSLDAARLVVVKPESRLGANGVEEARGPGVKRIPNNGQWMPMEHMYT